MHRLIATALLALLLAACQSTSAIGNADGLTVETAVRVTSVQAERRWIQQNYPGATVESQALLIDPVPMDRITIQLPSGATRDIYFDISSFFGKM